MLSSTPVEMKRSDRASTMRMCTRRLPASPPRASTRRKPSRATAATRKSTGRLPAKWFRVWAHQAPRKGPSRLPPPGVTNSESRAISVTRATESSRRPQASMTSEGPAGFSSSSSRPARPLDFGWAFPGLRLAVFIDMGSGLRSFVKISADDLGLLAGVADDHFDFAAELAVLRLHVGERDALAQGRRHGAGGDHARFRSAGAD